MTPQPQKVNLDTSLADVARLLLSSTFTALPVVDGEDRPVGVISQGDLLYKAGMPMRLGLLAESERDKVEAVLEALAPRRTREVMTQPAVTIGQDAWVTEAVDLMLKKKVKSLPVIDAGGRLAGILSRSDVFHSILRECPDWHAFRQQKITVEKLRVIADIMHRDTAMVLPDTPVEEVLRLIDCSDIQRVCVVDQEGAFLGLIADRDLLAAFAEHPLGLWDYFVSKMHVTERGRRHKELGEQLRARTAGEVMNTDIITVQEDTPINEAIRLMLERAINRLPVLDAQGKFRGMVSREDLLRVGYAAH
jgi:CBS domain-containing protein